MMRHYYFETAEVGQRWKNLVDKSIVAETEKEALDDYYSLIKHDYGYDDAEFGEWLDKNVTRLYASGNYTVYIIGGQEDGKAVFESPYEEIASRIYDEIVRGLNYDSTIGVGYDDPLGNDIGY